MKPPNLFHKFTLEKEDLWLWLPVFFGFGAAFYLVFAASFLENITKILLLFFCAAVGYFLNRNSRRSLVFVSCLLFLLGGFYANFYQKIFINPNKITGKIYVDVIGKVESVKKFHNPQNSLDGANLVIAKPVLYKPKFVEKKKIHKKTKKKKSKKPKKKTKKKTDKKKKPKKKRAKKKSDESLLNKDLSEEKVEEKAQENLEEKLEEKVEEKVEEKPKENLDEKPKEKPKKKAKKKRPKKRKISEKTIRKNFVNLADYQEIDRKFLDQKKNYHKVNWVKVGEQERVANPPQKISINLVKNFEEIAVNDVVAVRAMLQPPQAKEFPNDPDFALDADMKKIGGFGFAIGAAKIMRKAEISTMDSWFLYLREKVREKISTATSGDSAAIITALLIGDQRQISADLMTQIRNSGLAHLLSISGFHLSLAASIFFVATRFLLSRSQYLALHFDLKKFAAVAAIISTFFYLKIADAPIPAQRAFLMVLLTLTALFVGEKLNARRAIMTSVLALILLNPLVILNLSFQLSFAAILILASFYDKKKLLSLNIFQRFLKYFFDIILLSIILQIAMAPFLMHTFRNVTMLGFVANILAIPLASFLIMPLGFLALLLMPFSLDFWVLKLMNFGVLLLQKSAIFAANLPYANFVSPQLSGIGLAIAVIGLLLFCLAKNYWRFVGVAIFFLAFVTILFDKKPDILFDGNQKFFAIYNQKDGLQFSKNLRASKKRQRWMEKMDEKDFKLLPPDFCDEEKCVITKEKTFLILTARNKTAEICKNNFDIIVNLTSKYQLPSCISKEKMVIDNLDFHRHGGHFVYIKNGEILLKTSY